MRGPPPAARQQRLGRPAALGASVSWDGASSCGPSRLLDDTDMGPSQGSEQVVPAVAVDSRRSGCGGSNGAAYAHCEIQPIDSDDDGSGGPAAGSSTAAQGSRGTFSAGSRQQGGLAAPSHAQHRREDGVQSGVEMAIVHAPAAGQPRGMRTISRVGLRAAADPRCINLELGTTQMSSNANDIGTELLSRVVKMFLLLNFLHVCSWLPEHLATLNLHVFPRWRTDPRRMAAVRELLRGRSRGGASVQDPPAAPAAELGRGGAAQQEPTPPPTSAESSQQPSDLDIIGASNDLLIWLPFAGSSAPLCCRQGQGV